MKITHIQSSNINNHKDRRRINSLREHIHSRQVALKEAKKRYQTGNEYLEESQKILERDRFVLLIFEIGF
jgi:hypothetical protein